MDTVWFIALGILLVLVILVGYVYFTSEDVTAYLTDKEKKEFDEIMTRCFREGPDDYDKNDIARAKDLFALNDERKKEAESKCQ